MDGPAEALEQARQMFQLLEASIKGGTEKKLAAGDVATIPAKVPHQVKLDAGKAFTYFVVKVTQP